MFSKGNTKLVRKYKQREAKIVALHTEKTPESRKQRKQMNVQFVGKRYTAPGKFWNNKEV